MKVHLKYRIFNILPSNFISGPIKSAFAMSNGLVNTCEDKIFF